MTACFKASQASNFVLCYLTAEVLPFVVCVGGGGEGLTNRLLCERFSGMVKGWYVQVGVYVCLDV